MTDCDSETSARCPYHQRCSVIRCVSHILFLFYCFLTISPAVKRSKSERCQTQRLRVKSGKNWPPRMNERRTNPESESQKTLGERYNLPRATPAHELLS
ncbi:hypothetical protein BU25DRAFT_183413 [Macroventuria anomochaeta]|uniref:Uncharacterized protein n=1 Tax=Macroventuria anomochaeta TaxID=301207 RepID=A0ACB6RMU3_9PLEO|nr:uncharacterized protein BU25DRAFT_183413 [Macroventuria anomochaeta]KAF2623133.1 hypothetical protein BU25DRAFT_183413 [Macroventuria anomochaeta]